MFEKHVLGCAVRMALSYKRNRNQQKYGFHLIIGLRK